MTEDEKNARKICREQGMDPDFVGDKGYPNWKDYTEEARNNLKNFLRKQAEIFGFMPDDIKAHYFSDDVEK